MGVNINRDRSNRADRDWTAFLVIVGVLALGTVLAVWTAQPRVVPPTFGTAGGITVISLSLIGLLAAAFSPRRAKRLRRTAGTATILLAVAAELLALGHLGSGAGPADTGLGWVLSAGAVAMAGLAVRALKGGPR